MQSAFLLADAVIFNDGLWGAYLRGLLLLGGLLCLGILLLRGLKTRLLATRKADGQVELIDRFCLETRRNLYIVRVGSSHFLLASSESGVQLLKENVLLGTCDASGEQTRGGLAS
jgi:flagellar biogenesis protein FliO